MLAIHQATRIWLTALTAGIVVSSSPTASSPWDCDKFLCRFTPGSPGKSTWCKWDDLKELVVFGASYAAAGSESDILNPKPPYKTSCNGPNYVDVLSNGVNKSVISTKSYAIPGSPTSWNALGVNENQQNDFVHQVDAYIADLNQGKFPGLSAKNTLYLTHFGINDINTSGPKYSSLENAIFEKYRNTFDRLYQSGARNFLVLNVAPIDRSPRAAAEGQATIKLWRDNVISFNTRTSFMISDLGNKYNDASFFRMGVNGLFSSIIDKPAYSDPTKIYKDTKQTCAAYANDNNLPSKDYKSPECIYAVNEYFWLNGYHPTYPMHEAMASEIADGLQKV